MSKPSYTTATVDEALTVFINQAMQRCAEYDGFWDESNGRITKDHPIFCALVALCSSVVRRPHNFKEDPQALIAAMLLELCGVDVADVLAGKFGYTALDKMKAVEIDEPIGGYGDLPS